MITVHKEVDGINCHYKGHGNATHFLNACGVFTDEDLGWAYSSDDWGIDMNAWFAVHALGTVLFGSFAPLVYFLVRESRHPVSVRAADRFPAEL